MFKFRKIASVLASAAMVCSTVALAAAANYPAPFVKNGSADVAVVYGTMGAAQTDLTAATDIQASLASSLASQTASSSGTSTVVSGEAFPLFTSSTEIYLNDSINVAKNILTKDDMENTLMDGDFSGDVDEDYTQTINLNPVARVQFGQQPTSDDDPTVYVSLGTSTSTSLYNSTVIFDGPINFTDEDSQGEEIELFGHQWTVGADTDNSELVLYRSSESITLSKGGSSPSPTSTVTVDGDDYTVELIASSDDSATIKVTDSTGKSQTREINEDESRKVNGVEVAVTYADESDSLGITAEITVGSQKVILSNGNPVKVGSDEDSLDGTMVSFTGSPDDLTAIRVQTFSDDTDEDALLAGGSFVDPVWESFKFDFTTVTAPMNSSDRETVSLRNSGDDELRVSFTDYNDDDAAFTYYYANGANNLSYGDGVREKIKVVENALVNKSNYLMVGNQDEGHLIELTEVTNNSNGYSDDKVRFKDVISDDTYDASITGEGQGTVTIGGKIYSLKYGYAGASTASDSDSDSRFVRVDYPDSSSGKVILYPTIETSKGAKLGLYEPVTLNVTDYDGSGTDVTALIFPDGDDYASDISVDPTIGGSTNAAGNFTVNGVLIGNGTSSTTVSAGKLSYNVTFNAADQVKIFLLDPRGGNVVAPAVVLFEEEEDRTNAFNALVAVSEGAGTDSDGLGVSTVVSTNGMNGAASYTDLESDDDLSQLMTTYGTIVTMDDSESDQKTADISYSDDQVQALIYAAEATAVIGSDDNGATLGTVVMTDSEAASASGKNLIVVGGNCVNSVAASLLGLPSGAASCLSDFSSKTSVTSGQFLIETFDRTGGNVATLVAGYNAADTMNAAQYLTTKTVDTTSGKKYTGTSATEATLVTA